MNDTLGRLDLANSITWLTGQAGGYTRTVTAANTSSAAVPQDLAMLESQAAAGKIDLIVKGTLN